MTTPFGRRTIDGLCSLHGITGNWDTNDGREKKDMMKNNWLTTKPTRKERTREWQGSNCLNKTSSRKSTTCEE